MRDFMTSRAASLLSLALAALLVSSLFASAPSTGGLLTPPWDKVAHLMFFGTIGFLLSFGLGRTRLLLAFVVTVAIGAADETYQAFLPTRHADWGDFTTDLIAALLAMGIARFWLPSSAGDTTSNDAARP